MTRTIIGPIRCICGWTGTGHAGTPCATCGSLDRVTKRRAEVLCALRDGGRVELQPRMRDWMVERRLIVAAAPPRPPILRPIRHRNRPRPRPYAVTDAGRRAVAGLGGRP